MSAVDFPASVHIGKRTAGCEPIIFENNFYLLNSFQMTEAPPTVALPGNCVSNTLMHPPGFRMSLKTMHPQSFWVNSEEPPPPPPPKHSGQLALPGWQPWLGSVTQGTSSQKISGSKQQGVVGAAGLALRIGLGATATRIAASHIRHFVVVARKSESFLDQIAVAGGPVVVPP